MALAKNETGLKNPKAPAAKKGEGNEAKSIPGLKVDEAATKLFKRKPVGKA